MKLHLFDYIQLVFIGYMNFTFIFNVTNTKKSTEKNKSVIIIIYRVCISIFSIHTSFSPRIVFLHYLFYIYHFIVILLMQVSWWKSDKQYRQQHLSWVITASNSVSLLLTVLFLKINIQPISLFTTYMQKCLLHGSIPLQTTNYHLVTGGITMMSKNIFFDGKYCLRFSGLVNVGR